MKAHQKPAELLERSNTSQISRVRSDRCTEHFDHYSEPEHDFYIILPIRMGTSFSLVFLLDRMPPNWIAVQLLRFSILRSLSQAKLKFHFEPSKWKVSQAAHSHQSASPLFTELDFGHAA